MDAPQDGSPLDNQPSRSAPTSVCTTSNDPTPCHDPDTPIPLTQHESALLDNSSVLLEQEYDYQRQLITHYSDIRHHSTQYATNGNLSQHKNTTEQLIPPSWPHTYEKSRESPLFPPPIFTSMEDGIYKKGYPASYTNAYAYQYQQPRRPLIDYITNQWRSSTSSPPFSPSSAPAPSLLRIMLAPRIRRYIMIVILVILLPWTSWKWYVRPRWHEHQLLNDAFNEKSRTGSAWYGTNLRPAFKDMIQLQTLDSSQLPQGENKTRLIFVGDVHGCYDERKYFLSCSLLAYSGMHNLT